METENNDPLIVLLKYKKLAEDSTNHSELVKDKTMMNFLLFNLDCPDVDVQKTSLDILLLLCETSCGRVAIRTKGFKVPLVDLAKNLNIQSTIQKNAEKILQRLNNLESPEKGSAKPVQLKKKKVLTLHIHGLHLETQKELEDILTKKMKGVHSVIVDVEHQKCTVTVYEHVDPKNVAFVISENTDMEAKLITRNKFNQEILVPLIENEKTLDLEDLPPYLEEKDSPVKEKAVRSAKDMRITASEWFCTAAGLLQRALYW